MRRKAPYVSVDLADRHTRADFHSPFEVKDSMENLLTVMEFSPEKDTNACTSKGLHTVHGVLNSKAYPSQVNSCCLAVMLSKEGHAGGRRYCVVWVVTHLRYIGQDIQVEVSQEQFKMLPGFVRFCKYV